MTEYFDYMRNTQRNLEIFNNLSTQLNNNFRLLHNNFVSFFIYLHPIDNFFTNKLMYEELINNYLQLNKKIKKIFIFIYNNYSSIELNDSYVVITTDKKPESFINNFLLKVKNLEGLRIIADRLNITHVNDKRNVKLLKNLPYLEYIDLNNIYKIYKNSYKKHNSVINKLEEHLLDNDKRMYFIYFKKNINQIEYIEKSLKHIILFYPEYKKSDLLDLMKSI